MKRAGFNKELLAANFGKLEKLVRQARVDRAARRPGRATARTTPTTTASAAAQGRRSCARRRRGGARGSPGTSAATTAGTRASPPSHADLVVAFDADHATVDALYRRLRDERRDGHPPARHERHRPVARPRLARARARRRSSAAARPSWRSASRVVHHVCITGNVPGARASSTGCARSTRALVIEFPDRGDPMVQRLLGGKRDGQQPGLRAGGVRARAGGALHGRAAARRCPARARSTKPSRAA